jgi:hypothetical protein
VLVELVGYNQANLVNASVRPKKFLSPSVDIEKYFIASVFLSEGITVLYIIIKFQVIVLIVVSF